MHKLLTVTTLAVFLALPSLVLAQAKTDLSGTWTFDEAKSAGDQTRKLVYTKNSPST